MITAHATVYEKHGEPADVLRTLAFQIDESNLGPYEIVVRTLASPVNPSDINQIQGVYPLQPGFNTDLGSECPVLVCGNEGLFEVTHVGAEVSRLSVGDWCVPSAVNFGTWRTHAKGTEDSFIQLPNPEQLKANGKPHALSVHLGATIMVNPPTALLMLTHYKKMRPGRDWFIQNGGNSTVGVYATQIGSLLGIKSISVIRDRDDFKALLETLISEKGATKVISASQNELREFADTVKAWVQETDGELKLALNCVGGSSCTAIARKLLNDGEILTYGGMSMKPVTLPTTLYIFKNIVSRGFWVTELLKKDMPLKMKTLKQIVEWYEQGKLQVAPCTKVPLSDPQEIGDVYATAIANSKKGKQLIVY